MPFSTSPPSSTVSTVNPGAAQALPSTCSVQSVPGASGGASVANASSRIARSRPTWLFVLATVKSHAR
jgi:hypothetical protein